MHWLLGLRTPLKPRVPVILADLPLVAHPLKLNPRSAAAKRKKSELQHFEIQLTFDFVIVRYFFCGTKKLSPKE